MPWCTTLAVLCLQGKVSMDRHGGPGGYVESTDDAIAAAEAFIQYVRAKKLSRLQPVLTPRFLPTCTPRLLSALGDLAARYDAVVQVAVNLPKLC
jgi:guanine deaminase